MLYFQLVIMAGTVMLAYYFEYTDTFNVHVQGFFCHDNAYMKPYLGPEESSAIPPVILYAVVAGVPVLVITAAESVLFLLQYISEDLDNREKIIVMGDCCYLNPLVRRTFRFLGVYAFGLFATDIFVNAGQVVTGNMSPYFLTVCKPNYTALGCQQTTRFISQQDACTGNSEDVTRARKSFPSKEAALSVYAALYVSMYIMCRVKAKGTRLAKPVVSLGLTCLAFLTGINRVVEYRNHWADVIAGFVIGGAIAVFVVVCVVKNFKGKPLLSVMPPEESAPSAHLLRQPRVEHAVEKYGAPQSPITYAEVT
ncbi:phospholipid phosphatase-related protein type 5a [Brachyhypopomus gauderio]|uniref:phospholipid phosphatase-related protein type 5a n=1 Tax=Brachyhypopomus gauderio TaxID=698409 RepID=UPI004042B961